MNNTKYPRTIYGIDFSGAKDAGRRIWITKGIVENNAIQIVRCERCAELPHSSKELEPCLQALKEFIVRQKKAAVGLDFPFGLPKDLVDEDTWEDFVKAFPEKYDGPDSFRDACRRAAGGKELKRLTDREAKTPFCCYNLRLYKQTYYGISRLLTPLVRENKVRVIPMQDPEPDKPWALEICPASTLKQLNLYTSYKKNTKEQRETRTHILAELEKRGPLRFTDDSLRNKVIDDSGGDALDSLIAAVTTFQVLRNPSKLFPKSSNRYAIEGYVYLGFEEQSGLDITESVHSALRTLENEFRAEPTLFFTEHDLVSRAYQLIQQELGQLRVYGSDGTAHYLVHHEYPTPFRCDMIGSTFEIREEDARTPRGGKYQRGHYDLVVFNPDFLEGCDYQLAKGQDFQVVKRKMPDILAELRRAPIVVGIEFMFNRDDFTSESHLKRWWNGVMQDFKKLCASKNWQDHPFMQQIIMMAFDTSGKAAHHEIIKRDLLEHPEIRYCCPDE